MIVVRILVGLLALVGVGAVLASVVRTVVLPRAVPAFLGRFAFLSVREALLVRVRMTGRSDYRTRDRIFSLQAPLGVFAQLFTWAMLLFVGFAAMFWAATAHRVDGSSVARALELSGSSMLTLGFDRPDGLARQLLAFAAASVGLTLLAVVITYIPTLYGAFSRREALITKLVVRTGVSPSGPALLESTWKLERFDQIDEVWNDWEDWFITLGETHTTFPQLAFFRSPHPRNHWVLATETVLDGSALFMTVCDVPRHARSELCLRAGVHALFAIANFYGVPHQPPEPGAQIALPEEKFDRARRELQELGVPVRADRDQTWSDFRALRARYEALLALIGRMTDAPAGDWSPWSEATPRHVPPLVGIGRR